MKTLLVTSEITFVPDNYDEMICGMADCPQIGGLLILRNGNLKLFFKGLTLILAGAPRFGKTLIRNSFSRSSKRLKTYNALNKPVWFLDTINCEQALALLRNHQFDLVVNARTRYLYKEPILKQPPLGCLNIHHGLLPEQRGLMCDLWALAENQPAGFTIHKMNQKIDDGKILERVVASKNGENDFIDYIHKASRLECETLKKLLSQIETNGMPEGTPNISTGEIKMRKTPSFKDIKSFRLKGLLL